jgi:adenosine deaminase
VLENFEKKLSIVEVKYRNKVKIPWIFKRFEKKYNENLEKKIIITKDICKYEEGVYFIPACILGNVKI